MKGPTKRKEVSDLDDKTIIMLYFDRNPYAIHETKDQYGKYCYRIAMNLLSSHEDAEEVVNDTYTMAWQSIPPQKPSNLQAFLGKITRNLSLNRLEKRRAEKRNCAEVLVFDELSEVISPREEDLVDKLALDAALKSFLSSLPTDDRILFVKRYWYGESVQSLSRELYLTKSAVKTKLHRLRNRLKAHLRSEGVLPRRLYETE